jgi:4'-phosphopantetheinyl transferase EntD
VTGSITHTTGYAAVLAAPCEKFPAIGLDAERIGGVTAHLHARLFDAAEQDWLARQDDVAIAATRLFCAKEAGIKAWRPVTGRPLSFRDIHIEVRGDGFAATVRDEPKPAAGRFAVQDDLMLAALYLPAP